MSRILVIHPSLGYGGAEKMLAYVSNTFSQKHNVKLLLLQSHEITLELDSKIEIESYELYFDKPIMGINMFLGLHLFHKMVKIIRKEAIKFQADIVFCFDLRILVAAYLAVRNLHVHFIFSERADPYYNSKRWAIILKYIFMKIDYIVFQTKGAQEFYTSAIQEKSCIIPNPAIPRSFDENNEIIRYEFPYIFSAGQMVGRKGFDILLKAFSKIKKECKEYKLVLYGSGNQKDKLIEMAKRLDIQDSVLFYPAINNVIEKNKNAKLFILSSTSEGIPNIMIEAMMNDIPVVATDCSPGGARLLSDDGKYCYLVQNKNKDELAEKILYALKHLNEANVKAKKAKASMVRFDSGKIGNMWLDVVDFVLKQ